MSTTPRPAVVDDPALSSAVGWYADSTPLPAASAPLRGDISADVCILGGGYTGLSAALELATRGFKGVVLEAERTGWGASGRNGGQALVGYGCDLSVLERELGTADAHKAFALSVEGLELLRRRIAAHGIDCDWQSGHASVAVRRRQLPALQEEAARMQRLGVPVQWWDQSALRAQVASPRYHGGLFDPLSGHLHPLAFALGLARAAREAGVVIHEHSAVTLLQREPQPVMRTAQGSVRARHAVIAGNAWLRGIAPELEARIMPVGTYVGATPPLGAARANALIRNGMAVADVNWALDYFRLSADHRLLFGGRASYSARPPLRLRASMTQRMHTVFPQLRDVSLDDAWGGFIDITRNRAPHWGRLTPDIWFAQGFSGHGVAAAGLAGLLIAEAIAGQSGRIEVFERIQHRPFPGGRLLRMPLLVAAMSWYKLRDALW